MSLTSAALPVLAYLSMQCTYSIEGVVQKTVAKDLITLAIENDVGRFVEIQFGDAEKKIQYQILLENDPQDSEAINVLQNFLVEELESSSELLAVRPKNFRVSQGAHRVSCVATLKK